MLKATAVSSYRSQKGFKTFVYNVTGTAAELARYKEAQGDNYRETPDTNVPLYFFAMTSGRSPKPVFNLIITTNNRVVIDDTKEVLAREAIIDAAMVQQQAIVRAQIAEGVLTLAPKTTVNVPSIPNIAAPVGAPGAGTEDSTVAELETSTAGAGTEDLGA